MKIAVIGTGYVGLVTGVCFADMGIDVVCVDNNITKIDNLRKGILPIYEPGLDELVLRNVAAGRLSFSTSLPDVLPLSEVVFIAVGTPSNEDGSADMTYVLNVAAEIGRHMESYKLVVTKSTVPVGSSAKVKERIAGELHKRGAEIDFDVASNPEFLKEGNAIKDFMSPDRVVIGVDDTKAKDILTRLYRPFLLNNFRVIFMDISSAEMTKYAANAMLATRISFMNDIANLCERMGADVNMVRKGIGSDSRIGSKFLYPGSGYGGSCFPKDVKALVRTGQEYGYRMRVIEAVEEVNDEQKNVLFNKISSYFKGNLRGRRIAIWGLAFKPETDDIRESTAIRLINQLIEAGAQVTVFDPVAMGETRKQIGDKVTYATDKYEALTNADAMAMVTEWKEFRLVSWPTVCKLMTSPVVFDGRNIYDQNELSQEGIQYFYIGGSNTP